jgi:phosphoglycolate phosphatase
MTTVIFDLDGTIVDTAPDLLASLNWVLTRAGHRTVAAGELRNLIGYGVRRLFERAFARTGTAVSDADMRVYCEEFLAHYRANIARGSRPYPKVPETLDHLAASGVRIGLCTNKPQALTELLLAELNLTRHFLAIYGPDKTTARKPDGRHILDVLHALKGDPLRAVMVGDGPVDVEAARNAKIPVIVMSHGYTPVAPHALGADAVLDDFAELPGAVARLIT